MDPYLSTHRASDTPSTESAGVPPTSDALVPIESIPQCRDFAFDPGRSSTSVNSSSCYFGAKASAVLKEQLSKEQLQKKPSPPPAAVGYSACAARKAPGKYECVQYEETFKELFGEDAYVQGHDDVERKPITWKTKVFNPLRVMREKNNP